MHFYTYVVKWYFHTDITTDSGIVVGSNFDEAIKNVMKSYDDIDSISLKSLNWDFENVLPLPNKFIKEIIDQSLKAINEGCGPEEID